MYAKPSVYFGMSTVFVECATESTWRTYMTIAITECFVPPWVGPLIAPGNHKEILTSLDSNSMVRVLA